MRLVTVILCLCLFTEPAWPAIDCADPNAIEFYDSTPLGTETIAYTTPAGNNQITFVLSGYRRGAPDYTGTSTVTIGGQGTTMTTTRTYTDPIAVQLFHRVNPPSGTNNVVVTHADGGTPLADAIIIFTCSGVDTASPFRDTNQSTGTSATPTVTLGSVQSGDVVIDVMASEHPADATVGADQTVIHVGNATVEIGAGASYQSGIDGGIMSWTISSQQWGEHAVALIPFGVTGGMRITPPMVLD